MSDINLHPCDCVDYCGDDPALKKGFVQACKQSLQTKNTSDNFDFHDHLSRQAYWSEQTFGPGSRAKGVIDHIRKELCEIEADPADLKEWVDVIILALDGAWRTGATPQQIIDAIVAKQNKNEGRVWPDWRTADPEKAIEHDRSFDAADAAPIVATVPSDKGDFQSWMERHPNYRFWNATDIAESAFLSGRKYAAPISTAADQASDVRNAAIDACAKIPREYAMQLDKSGFGNRFPDELTAIFNASTNMADKILALKSAVLAAITPVQVPDGFVIVPVEPTEDMQLAGAECIRIDTTAINKIFMSNRSYKAMLKFAPADINNIRQGNE